MAIAVLKRGGGGVRFPQGPSRRQLPRTVHSVHACILVHFAAALCRRSRVQVKKNGWLYAKVDLERKSKHF